MAESRPPLLLEPRVFEKPWGGRRLIDSFGKRPSGANIGESWELAPSNAAGARLPLIKWIDAAENLSVQNHPVPVAGVSTSPYEAWFIVHADPDSMLIIDAAPACGVDEIRAQAGGPGLVALLRRWPATPGALFVVPAGTIHAIGAGVTLVEVQATVSETYRLFDWGRVDTDGRPRPLNVELALRNLRRIRDPQSIRPEPITSRPGGLEMRAWGLEGMAITHVRAGGACASAAPGGGWVACTLTSGKLRFRGDFEPLVGRAGDTLLFPPECEGIMEYEAGAEMLWVR